MGGRYLREEKLTMVRSFQKSILATCFLAVFLSGCASTEINGYSSSTNTHSDDSVDNSRVVRNLTANELRVRESVRSNSSRKRVE